MLAKECEMATQRGDNDSKRKAKGADGFANGPPQVTMSADVRALEIEYKSLLEKRIEEMKGSEVRLFILCRLESL